MKVLLLAAVLSGFNITGAHIVDYGIYDTIRIEEQTSPNTTEGTIHVLHPRLDPVLRKETRRVEARIGTQFGFRFQIDGKPRLAEVPVKIRVLHPPITNPETDKTSTTEEWDAAVNLGIPRFTGWAFDQQYETAAGTWTLQVLRDDKVMLQKEFVVVSP